MSKNSNVLVVIPIHEWDESIAEYVTIATRSVEEQTHKCDILIVCPPDKVNTGLDMFAGLGVLYNGGSTDFVTQSNLGLKFAIDEGYEWVSVLEFDDYYEKKWAELLLEYANHKNIDFVMPITMFETNKQFLGFFNEATWANGITEKVGYYDLQCLMNRNFIHLTSAIIKTSALNDFGILKNMNIVSTFEFVLRMVYNGVEPFVVPKILHHHLMNRKGSYTELSSQKMTPEEFQFWNEAARKQYFFVEDRNIVYEPTNV